MKGVDHLKELHKEVKGISFKKAERVSKTLPSDVVCKYVGEISIGGVLHRVYLTDWKFGGGEYGSIVPSANKIYLSKHQNPHNMLITLIHEMLHKVMEEYQLIRLISDGGSSWQVMENITETLDTPITNDLLLSQTNFKMFRRILSGEFSEEEE